MNAIAELAKPPSRRKPAQPPLIAPAPAVPAPARTFALRQLRRAPENVRHHDHAEAVTELAADIRAHGLLQNLIGYEERVLGRGEPVAAAEYDAARAELVGAVDGAQASEARS